LTLTKLPKPRIWSIIPPPPPPDRRVSGDGSGAEALADEGDEAGAVEHVPAAREHVAVPAQRRPTARVGPGGPRDKR